MDWTLAKERNYNALMRILAVLFSMIGMVRGESVPVVPRHVHSAVLRLLRPLESALRRLIIVEARALTAAPAVARAGGKSARVKAQRGAAATPRFSIIEPLQRVGIKKPPVAKGYGPRISFFDGFDPPHEPPKVILPDDPLDAGRLCRRLLSVQHALETLPEQALRLARWRARRDARLLRSARTRPLRPGRPPGHRKRRIHEIDEILGNCHALALYVQHHPPDTS